MERTVGLSETVTFNFTMGYVHRLPLQSGSSKCLVDMTYLPALELRKQIQDTSMDKKIGPDEMECNDGEGTM